MIRHASWRAAPLAALLALAPLPFGSVSPSFTTTLFLAALAALALAIVSPVDSNPSQPFAGRALLVPLAAVGGVALLGGMQAMAWPEWFARSLAPAIAKLATQAAELAGAPERMTAIPLSLAPEATRAATVDWLLFAAAALAAALVGGSRRHRRILLGAFVVAAAAQIAVGVQLWISRSDSLWGVTMAHIPGRLRGSFVNPNHLALFLEITLVVLFAWIWWSARRSALEEEPAEARLLRIGPAALAFLLTIAGLVLTSSRAGILAAVTALAVQGFLIGRRRGRTWLLGAGALAALAGIAFLLLFGVEGSLQRLVATPFDEVGASGRLRAAGATLDLWTLSPLTGVGLGAFRAAFPLVQPESIPGLWRHAHSDWIELLATTGVVGAALVGTALFLYARRLRTVIAHGESSEDRAAGIAAAGALVAVGLHSLVDFGLTIPANALALAVVLGAAAAARTKAPTAADGGSTPSQ